jgi:mycothiol synthase
MVSVSVALPEATRWTAHEVIINSFRGQFGFVPRPHAEWVEALGARSTFVWSQLTVLEVDGQAVAVRSCSDEFVEAENCGYVGMLGVVEGFRGRGLAKFLLRDSFAAMRLPSGPARSCTSTPTTRPRHSASTSRSA